MSKPEPDIQGATSPRGWGDFIRIVAYMLAFYLAITAFFGYRLGAQLHAAKSNPYVGIGTQILGPKATEDYMIQQSRLPAVVTASPAFWLALRLSE
ncbi:MAG TPA: hypothetical protein VFO29_08520 [Candidatus Rubrimentiphilum sp.]|nr:hypothetical protein [Candidatus Rubrimentiphilum sp.]